MTENNNNEWLATELLDVVSALTNRQRAELQRAISEPAATFADSEYLYAELSALWERMPTAVRLMGILLASELAAEDASRWDHRDR
jgi:hypothetical protein